MLLVTQSLRHSVTAVLSRCSSIHQSLGNLLGFLYAFPNQEILQLCLELTIHVVLHSKKGCDFRSFLLYTNVVQYSEVQMYH